MESTTSTSRDEIQTEEYLKPTPLGLPTLNDSADTRWRNAWLIIMSNAGIPPRYQEAHMASNCGRYSEEPGKLKALEAARTWARDQMVEQRGDDRFCLMLTGSFGGGKTWLATAALKDVLWRTKSGMWRKFHQFVREIQGAYGSSEEKVDELIRRYQKTPVLMLDDVGDLETPLETEDRRRLLYEVLDVRNDYFLPTILTTNLAPDALAAQFGERTFERVLEMCALIKMEGKNLRMEA